MDGWARIRADPLVYRIATAGALDFRWGNPGRPWLLMACLFVT